MGVYDSTVEIVVQLVFSNCRSDIIVTRFCGGIRNHLDELSNL